MTKRKLKKDGTEITNITNWYDPKKVTKFPDTEDEEHILLCAPEEEELLEKTGEEWNIGQSYEPDTATKVKCKICGGMHFEVATHSYFTGIRCITCQWEYCIHDG